MRFNFSGKFKILTVVALFTILISQVPLANASADVILWDYNYDGENLQVVLRNIGENSTKVYVSVRDGAGVIIGDPLYGVGTINKSGSSESDTLALTFKLPDDYNSVNVIFEYYSQTTASSVKVEKQETIYLPEVKPFNLSLSTSTPSVEGELDGTASYQITLTNEGEAGSVQFVVSGLPSSISAGFYSGSQKALSLAFAEDETKTLTLYLSLPSTVSGFEVGKNISFTVFTLTDDQMSEYVNGTPVDELGAVSLRLYLTPVGATSLNLSLENLFFRVNSGEVVSTTLTVTNNGTEAAEDLEFEITDLPYGWSASIGPDSFSSIAAGASAVAQVSVVLSDSASAGRYEITLTATSGDHEASESFEIRVQEAESNQILWIFAMVIAVFVIAGVMVKFKRR